MSDLVLGCIVIIILTFILNFFEERYLKKLIQEELKKYERNNN